MCLPALILGQVELESAKGNSTIITLSFIRKELVAGNSFLSLNRIKELSILNSYIEHWHFQGVFRPGSSKRRNKNEKPIWLCFLPCWRSCLCKSPISLLTWIFDSLFSLDLAAVKTLMEPPIELIEQPPALLGISLPYPALPVLTRTLLFLGKIPHFPDSSPTFLFPFRNLVRNHLYFSYLSHLTKWTEKHNNSFQRIERGSKSALLVIFKHRRYETE